MRNVYVDTNVLLAAYMPQDAFHESSREVYSRLGVEYMGYTSPLSIVEAAGVISRRIREFPPELVKGMMGTRLEALSLSERARLIAYRMLAKEGLNFFHVPGDVALDLFTLKVSMPTILSHALAHAVQLGLTAFDAYHYATAYDLIHLWKTPLSFFITNDRHFLELKSEIEKDLNLTVASSAEFAALKERNSS
ncbi:MAG: PIN domain-containing protein [Candidatus Bathyarchaeia archaeon]